LTEDNNKWHRKVRGREIMMSWEKISLAWLIGRRGLTDHPQNFKEIKPYWQQGATGSLL